MTVRRRPKKPKLECTRDYDRFVLVRRNRDVEEKKRKNLERSMDAYGFLCSHPIHVCSTDSGKLLVMGGQGRIHFAREKKLPVWYIVDDTPVDIPTIENTQRKWNVRDYVRSWAKDGKKAYVELQMFATQHGIPMLLAATILGDNAMQNISKAVRNGTFMVTDREHGERIARMYTAIRDTYPQLGGRFFIDALRAYALVDGLDDKRLVKGMRGCPELVVQYGSRDGYLTMVESAYNYRRRDRVPVKIPAENEMRKRNPANRKMAV